MLHSVGRRALHVRRLHNRAVPCTDRDPLTRGDVLHTAASRACQSVTRAVEQTTVSAALYTRNMSPDVREVFETAKALDREQIADLAYQLLRVLDDDSSPVDQDKVDAAWNLELERRVDDLESGTVRPVSHDETVAQARQLLTPRS